MRIAFVLNDLVPKGGVGRVVINLAKTLKKQGHKIQILTIDYDSNFIKKYGIEDTEIICCKNLKIFDRMRKIPIMGFLLQIIKFYLFGIFISTKISKNKPVIINSHYYLCGLSGLILSKITNIPHVLTIHGIRLSKAYMKTIHFWTDYLILNFIINRISYLISVDPSLKASKQFKEVSDRMEIIFPCLDDQFLKLIEPIKPEKKRADGLKLIFVGRLEKHKALKELFENLSENSHNWTDLKVVGSGNDESQLKRLSKKLKISNKIEFMGFLNGIKKIETMRKADIFISYSRSEGFPLVILEFFALGKPCMIFPVGGISFFHSKVENEKLGIFLKPGHIFLKEILTSSEFLEIFTHEKSESRREFVRNFYPEEIANEYLKFFRKIIKFNPNQSKKKCKLVNII